MKKQMLIIVMLMFIGHVIYGQTKLVPASVIIDLNKTISTKKDEHILPSTEDNINKIVLSENKANIVLNLSKGTLASLDEDEIEEITEHLLPLLPDLGVQQYIIGFEKNNQFVTLGSLLEPYEEIVLPTPYNHDKEDMVAERSGNEKEIPNLNTVIPAIPRKNGMLKDKTVWLSAGHGWVYKDNVWKTQRKNNFGVVEDFGSIEAVNYYLLKYLEKAGADVWTVRERDMNVNEVIVDDESEGFKMQGYWTQSISSGYNKNYRYIYSDSKVTAAAIYTPNIPEAGWYWVSVTFPSGDNRVKEARYLIRHAGGETLVTVNQETHGSTWLYLGQFYFEQGTQGNVILTNQSSDINQSIVADAIRFGGGKSSVPDPVGGLSGEPRFEEGAIYYSKFQGYPFGTNDVTVRPRYAEWELSKGSLAERNNACYVAWHTNGGGGTGTETFIYQENYTKGSPQLRDFIHQEVISDIKAEWDPNWKDRGRKSADFGELRNLKTMPGALIEIAFHDNPTDAEALKTPKFRQLTARAVYQGIVRYYAAKDKKTPVFLPEPPTHLYGKSNADGSITLNWKAPAFGGAGGDKATGYKVYVSTHGKAFVDGIATTDPTFVLTNAKGGLTYYFKVTATNAGGESFETPIIAVRPPSSKNIPVDFLIVDGFDRLDKLGAISQYDGDYLGTTKRLFIDRMNSYDYAVLHAQGLEKAGFSFDGALNEAVYDKMLNINTYKGLDWFLGEESSQDNSLNEAERRIIEAYLKQGGGLMISGSEHAYEISRMPDGADPVFYRNFLKSAYYADNAKTYSFKGYDGSFMENLNGSFSDAKGLYDVDFPDVLVPYGGGKTIFQYEGGRGGSAAIAYSGADFKVINFGFPIESIPNELTRNEVFSRAARFLVKPSVKKTDVVINFEEKDLDADNIKSLPNPARITPNPFESDITINIAEYETGAASFTLYDSKGQRVKKISWTHIQGRKKSISLSSAMPKGIYSYVIVVGEKSLNGKIYKKN
jgi:hypothetical protein